LVAILVLPYLMGLQIPPSFGLTWMVVLLTMGAYIMLNARDTMKVVLATSFALIAIALYKPGFVQAETARSFFGVHKVADSTDGRFRMLFHGTTIHGAQRLKNEDGTPSTGRPKLVSYYHAGGSITDGINAVREQRGTLGRVAVVGLGTGSMACFAKPGEHWQFFEIDSVVVRIAKDATKFRFLSECGGGDDIVLGDARLTLAESKDRYDLIILEAFTSDAVPVHLLTREAMAVYMSRLKDGGAILFHVSNRYMDLVSVVTDVAASHGLASVIRRDGPVPQEELRTNLSAGSLVVVVAKSDADLASFASRAKWQLQQPNGAVRAWTDDYSNILAAIWRLQSGTSGRASAAEQGASRP
jgi:spermidine synthase